MSNILIDMLNGGILSLADYLSAHVLFCLVPAFFIAGAIAVFVSKQAVLKYFGADVKKYISYAVASVSGTVLAVCSCTILPLFAGIYKRGAGIGPATAFLYSGPAINVLAIAYTAQVLGYELGLARAVSAIGMSVVIGFTMSLVFKADKSTGKTQVVELPEPTGVERPAWVLLALFASLILILVIGASKLEIVVRLPVVVALIVGVVILLRYYFNRDEMTEWGYETWDLTKKIFPILLAGAFVVGMIAVVLPPETFRPYLGDNSLPACLLGAVIGTMLYMPTLLEVPIIGGTFGYTEGIMAGGPALSLLLAGPAVSLPSLIVLYRVMGLQKTVVFAVVVVVTSTVAGFIYGNLFA